MTVWLILALCSFIAPTLAQSNGVIMSMDVPMNLAVGNMLPYAHFTPGDTVWFLGWVPSSAGAMVGTCIALLLLSILERWVAACLALAEQHWAESTSFSALENPLPSSMSLLSKQHGLPPFVPEFDIIRGVFFAAHLFLKILLMMAVMTFQLAFLLSIAIGAGVGETLFGRFTAVVHTHW